MLNKYVQWQRKKYSCNAGLGNIVLNFAYIILMVFCLSFKKTSSIGVLLLIIIGIYTAIFAYVRSHIECICKESDYEKCEDCPFWDCERIPPYKNKCDKCKEKGTGPYAKNSEKLPKEDK